MTTLKRTITSRQTLKRAYFEQKKSGQGNSGKEEYENMKIDNLKKEISGKGQS